MFSVLRNMLGNFSNDEASAAVKGGAYLVDVRTPDEFASGTVKGAVNIPLDQIPNQINKLKNKKHIVVFCRSGNRSSQAKSFLTQSGFTNVVDGGTWQNVRSLVES